MRQGLQMGFDLAAPDVSDRIAGLYCPKHRSVLPKQPRLSPAFRHDAVGARQSAAGVAAAQNKNPQDRSRGLLVA
jgi:hypothetical protein